MRHIVKEEVTFTQERTVYECDLCHEKTGPGGGWSRKCSPNPHAHYHTQEETDITCTLGDLYPDSNDDRERLFLDICPKCFVEKFIPGVEQTFGIRFHKHEGY